jgi:hypothetical protein
LYLNSQNKLKYKYKKKRELIGRKEEEERNNGKMEK